MQTWPTSYPNRTTLRYKTDPFSLNTISLNTLQTYFQKYRSTLYQYILTAYTLTLYSTDTPPIPRAPLYTSYPYRPTLYRTHPFHVDTDRILYIIQYRPVFYPYKPTLNTIHTHFKSFQLRERSQMTSSKFRGLQTHSPPPSSLPDHPLDDVIFHQHPPFPKMIFGKIIFY